MADKKTYVNGIIVKEKDGQYGSFLNVSIKIESLEQYKNEKGYVNVTLSKRKEPGKYGETHSVILNEYKPNNSSNLDF